MVNFNKINISNFRLGLTLPRNLHKVVMGLPTVHTPENPIQDSTEEEEEDSDDEWSAKAESVVESGDAESSGDESGEEGSGEEESEEEESGEEQTESIESKHAQKDSNQDGVNHDKYNKVVLDVTPDKSTRSNKRFAMRTRKLCMYTHISNWSNTSCQWQEEVLTNKSEEANFVPWPMA